MLDLLLDEHGKLQKRNAKVHSIANAQKNTREIALWVENVEKIQQNRSAPSVVYTHKMPDIDSLMQAWDGDFERVLDENPLPDVELDLPIEDMVRYACALLDIPIHEQNKDRSLVESTHLIFSLYSAFQTHFQAQRNV